jgi:hypothetical protein
VLAAVESVREHSNVRASARAPNPGARLTPSLGSPVASKVRSIPTIAIAAASSPSSVPPPSGEPVITLTRAKSLRPALTTGPTMVFKSQQARRVQSVFAVTLIDGTLPAVASPSATSAAPAPTATPSSSRSPSHAGSPSPSPLPSPSPSPAESPSPATPRPEEPAPSRREVIDAAALDAALDELNSATTPERVVTILVYAMENVARRVVVFAARSQAYEGRETNHGPSRNAVRALHVPASADTALKAAARTGRFVGPLPPGVANDGLRNVLGDPAEVIAGIVSVQARPALVYIAAGFDSRKLATRRGEELAKAASLTLERIVRERKK